MSIKILKNILLLSGLTIFSFFVFAPKAHASIIIKLPTSLGISTGLQGYWTMNGADYNSASTTAEVLDRSEN